MTIERTAAVLAALAVLTASAVAQDEGREPETAAAEVAAEAAESGPDDDSEALDDPELDVQGFDPTADDDFIPSEDIPADAPIAFPTDI